MTDSNANTSGLSDACAQEEADTLALKLTNAEIIAASWKDRATAAEARADRLAKVVADLKAAFGDPMTRRALGGHNETQQAAILAASAALQQETQP